MFFSCEGVDGTGKSTQCQLLASRLREEYGEDRVLLTHEPGGTPFGMKVRQLIKTESSLSTVSQFHLIEAQRDHHVTHVLRPAIEADKIVICDRFIDTSYVYQNEFMSEMEWYYYLTGYRIVPDMTFLMYTNDVVAIKKRMNLRAGVEMDHFDNASIEQLNLMQTLFFDLSKRYPRIVPINTDRPIEVIAAEIFAHVRIELEDTVYSEET